MRSNFFPELAIKMCLKNDEFGSAACVDLYAAVRLLVAVKRSTAYEETARLALNGETYIK